MSEIKLEAGQWYRLLDDRIGFCIGEGPKNGDIHYDHYPMLLVFNYAGDVYGWYTVEGVSADEADDNVVEHLPGCTGFDWVPPPKLQLREGAWYERADAKIVGPCRVDTEQPNGYGYKWCVGAWRYRDDGTNAVDAINHLVREVEPQQPKYRPFKNAEEFKPYRNRWVRYAQSDVNKTMQCVAFSDEGVTACVSFMPYRTAFESLVFEDGSPFGVINQ